MKARTLAIAAAVLLLATSMFASSTVHAGRCTDAWDDSEADDYCSATVGRILAGTGTGNCHLQISCSITVAVDETDTTFSPSRNTTQTPANTENLDICFARSSDAASGFDVDILVGCGSSETTSDNAVANGLSTD